MAYIETYKRDWSMRTILTVANVPTPPGLENYVYVKSIYSPDVVYWQGRYRMAFGVALYGPPPAGAVFAADAIALAESTDGIHWTFTRYLLLPDEETWLTPPAEWPQDGSMTNQVNDPCWRNFMFGTNIWLAYSATSPKSGNLFGNCGHLGISVWDVALTTPMVRNDRWLDGTAASSATASGYQRPAWRYVTPSDTEIWCDTVVVNGGTDIKWLSTPANSWGSLGSPTMVLELDQANSANMSLPYVGDGVVLSLQGAYYGTYGIVARERLTDAGSWSSPLMITELTGAVWDSWYHDQPCLTFDAGAPRLFFTGNRNQGDNTPLATIALAMGLESRYGTAEIGSLARPYRARVTKPPTIDRSLTDAFWGPVEVQSIRLSLANADGLLTDGYIAGGFRGQLITWKSYDEATLAAPITEFAGMIDEEALTEDGELELVGVNLDLAVFDTLIPTRVITTLEYPYALDVGRAVPVIRGTNPLLKLAYINDGNSGHFEYLVGWGPLTLAQLYREEQNLDGVQSFSKVPPSDYTVSTTDYPGRTTVRFTVRQTNYRGGLAGLWADVSGPTTARNPLMALLEILSDPVWGLNQRVNVAAFETMATRHGSLTDNIVLDFALTEQESAQNYLREIMMIYGIRLTMDPGGAGWTPTIDEPPVTFGLPLRDGPGAGPRTLEKVGTLARVSSADRVKSFRLEYGYDDGTGRYLYPATRILDVIGRDMVERTRFIRDHVSADRLCDYLAKRIYYGQDRLTGLRTLREGATLMEGAIVPVTIAQHGLDGDVFEVRRIKKGLTTTELELSRWHHVIHHYSPAVILPTDRIINIVAPGAPPTPPSETVDDLVSESFGYAPTLIVTADSTYHLLADFVFNNLAGNTLTISGIVTVWGIVGSGEGTTAIKVRVRDTTSGLNAEATLDPLPYGGKYTLHAINTEGSAAGGNHTIELHLWANGAASGYVYGDLSAYSVAPA